MFALLCFDIGNERWTTSGFLTRLSNGGPPQVPGTHAGTRGAGEFDGIIAAVKEDEIYYHRDQCDMITMILRLAAEPAWRYERGRQTTPAADRNRRIGGCSSVALFCVGSCPGGGCNGSLILIFLFSLFCSFTAPVSLFSRFCAQQTLLSLRNEAHKEEEEDATWTEKDL